MSKLITMLVALVLIATAGLAAAQQPAGPATPTPTAPIKRTILQRTDVPGTNLELIYASVEISAGFKAGRHTHPGVVMAQIVDGDFWLQLDGQPEQVFHAGESLTLPDRAVHNEGSLDKPVKINVVYVVEKGKPLVSPMQ
jgi:quercetin dioxygenase-like cupin family protein